MALTYFALGKSVALMTVFIWLRFLSVLLLPLSFFVSARLMGLSRLTALGAAILAPLVSTNFLYGIEYTSYLWAGSGLFTQAVAVHFLLLALGMAFQAIRQGRRQALAGALLGLTFLSHLVYGYIGALSVCLLALMPDSEPRGVRILRAVRSGAVALLLVLFQLLPLLLDRGSINHSRWEPAWKWDSFAPGQVLGWLARGELLDFGRLPILSLLAAGGIGLWWWRGRRGTGCPAHTFAVCGAALWIAIFCGRALWGPLLSAAGITTDTHLHRVIGGAQIFLVLLAATAFAAHVPRTGQAQACRSGGGGSRDSALPHGERSRPVPREQRGMGRRNLAAYEAVKNPLEATLAAAAARGGRAYAGLAATWGGKFKTGDVPFYGFFSTHHVPAVGFLYHSMALTGDIMVRFNDWNPAHYRLFNIRTVVWPAGSTAAIPAFLTPARQNGNFRVFEAPGAGYFDLVDVPGAVRTSRTNFYEVNDRWLQTNGAACGSTCCSIGMARRRPGLARFARGTAVGFVRFVSGRRIRAAGMAGGAGLPGGIASAPAGLPDFPYDLASALARSGGWQRAGNRDALPGVRGCGGAARCAPRGLPLCAGALENGTGNPGAPVDSGADGSGGRPDTGRQSCRAAASAPVLSPGFRRRCAIAGGLAALALPVCIPLFTSDVLLGHDAFCYFPRLVEIHQNVTHGILLPRWAPDLGRGSGQPLFIFHPPFFYWLGELWHLMGFGTAAAVNLACAMLVVASAAAMFLLARLYFGTLGGWLGAAAYIYAPYFAVDLFVRSALEEFAAFPLFPLALFGFAAYAQRRQSRYLLLGSTAYALILASHFPAALLFSPVLASFLFFSAWRSRSWTVFANQAAALLLGMGLSAFAWIPALAERHDVALERAVQGYARYTNHFVYLHQLLYSPWGYGLSVPGPDDGLSFALGWGHLVVLSAAWIVLALRGKPAERHVLGFFGAVGSILCFMMLPDAVWLWDHLPLLQYVELPWRLLGPVAVCTAMLAAAAGPAFLALPRGRLAALAAAFALLIVPNLPHLKSRQTQTVDPALWTPRQLAITGFETTTMGELTPRWTRVPPPYDPAAVRWTSGGGEIREIARTPFFWSGDVTAVVGSTLRMSTAWYPGWQVRIDGRAQTAGPDTATGAITFLLPEGRHQVTVAWESTGPRRAAAMLSLVSLLAMMAVATRRARAAAQKYFHKILDKKILNCYYWIKQTASQAVSPLPPPLSECRPRVPSPGPLTFLGHPSKPLR